MYIKKEAQNWVCPNPGKNKQFKISELFDPAYECVGSIDRVTYGFRICAYFFSIQTLLQTIITQQQK